MQISSTSADFKQTFSEFHSQIEQTLLSAFNSRFPDSLYHPIMYLFEGGGKRLRPILTMVAAGAVGNNPNDALQSGVAMEILHNFTLVHDDIMDKSPIRRGRETIHKRWNESAAILSGDVMIGIAYQLIISSTCSKPRFADILTSFTQGLVQVCEGQAIDMDFQHQANVSMDEYIGMIEKKTARLLEMSAAIGGFVGNGSAEQNAALRKFALHLGIAFQIQDDLLDLTAQQHELGKFIGQDIVEGKKTYLIIRATEKATDEHHRVLLKNFYDEKGLSGTFIEQMKTMMNELGVFADAQHEVNRQLESACSALEALPRNYYTSMLEWITTIVNERKK